MGGSGPQRGQPAVLWGGTGHPAGTRQTQLQRAARSGSARLRGSLLRVVVSLEPLSWVTGRGGQNGDLATLAQLGPRAGRRLGGLVR